MLTPDERRLLDALADQAAVAIERVSLARGLAEARVLAEIERWAALLTSISHDVRTPPASIIGTQNDPRERDEWLATLQGDAERLNRFNGNLKAAAPRDGVPFQET